MKTLGLFLLAALFVATIASAQTNSSEVKQYGTNLGVVEQTGSTNIGNIYQGDVGAPVTNYHIPAYASDWIVGSWIKQIGDRNKAITDVNNNSNATKIYQLGDDNEGYQDINGYSSYTNANKPMAILIDQQGDLNEGHQKTVARFGCYSIQDMKIYQTGVDNYAKQLSVGGMSSVMKITQTGDNNNNAANNPLNVSCTGQQNPLTLPWSEKPAGDFSQYQNGRYSNAIATVTGNDNNTAQYQEYTVWSVSGDNDAYITIVGDMNDGVQGQLGEYNSSTISILGDCNVAASSQWGDSNTATITITGNSNCAGIEQKDDHNTGTVLQIGNGNKGLITQHPGGM